MHYSVQEQNYYGYIYITLDQRGNKVYVGQKKGKIEDSEDYFGSGTIIRRIINKYGEYFLKKIVLGVCYSKEELTFWETECKYFFKALDSKYGYNIIEKDTGGDTLSNHPDKELICKKMQISALNRPPISDEHREQLCNAHKLSYILNPNLRIQVSQFFTNYFSDPLNREKSSLLSKKIWSNPYLREQSSESHKQYWENLDEDSYNKRCQTVKDSWTEERKKEWSTQVKNEYREEKRISWNKNNSECFSDETMCKLSNASSGKNNPRYNIVEYKFLIIKYFEGLHMNEILFHYEKLYNKNIKGRVYNRFLEVLNFPTNCISKYAMKKAREDYKNFIEENKHKIQWYIDNYEKLEEEYFYNNRKYK